MRPTSTTGLLRAYALICSTVLLSACGGGDGPGRSNNPAPPNTIGPAGGTVQGPNGSQVVVPAGALTQDTAIAIAASSSGAPAVPTGMQLASEVFALTPHGTSFSTPVTITFPFDPGRVPAGVTPAVYKTNATQSGWEAVPGATLSGSQVSVQVSSFSWFALALLPPQITQQPQSLTVDEGASARFTVGALGTPPFTFQWQRSNDSGATFTDIPGANANAFEISNATDTDNGAQFRAIVSNLEGGSTSQPATLTVTSVAAGLAITTEPFDQAALPGAAATFSVVTTGTALQFQWQRWNDAGARFDDIAGAVAADFTLANVSGADANARFRVRVANSAGSLVSRSATLFLSATVPATGPRISGGHFNTFVRLGNGTAVSWGLDNNSGSLGAGPGVDSRLVPGPVLALANVVSLATSEVGSSAVLSNGEAWLWGGAIFGVNTFRAVYVPERIPGLTHVKAACVGSHRLFLLNDGSVRAMGVNSFGQLGDGTELSRSSPVPVQGLQGVTAIACGMFHSLALLADGTVRAWGGNSLGELGNGTTSFESHSTPVVVRDLEGVIALAAGRGHSLALRNDGTVWAWGGNRTGQLGDGTNNFSTTPVAILDAGRYTAIAAGAFNSAALRVDGSVLTWGDNLYGQLGIGTTGVPDMSTTPVRVDALGSNVVEVAVGENQRGHMIAVLRDGTVWTWGSNMFGETGDGQSNPVAHSPSPVQVSGLNLN